MFLRDSGTVPRPPEILFLLFFRSVRLSLRIQSLHLIEFLGRDLRQVPDEQNQVPGIGVAADTMLFAEGRHAGQPNAVFNGVVQLAIALVLRLGRAHIRWFWIQAFAKYGVAAAVVRMARGAMIGKMLHAGSDILG